MAPIVRIKWAGSEFKWVTLTRMHVHTCKHTYLFYRHAFRSVNLLCSCWIHAPAMFTFRSYLGTWVHRQEMLAEPVNFKQWAAEALHRAYLLYRNMDTCTILATETTRCDLVVQAAVIFNFLCFKFSIHSYFLLKSVQSKNNSSAEDGLQKTLVNLRKLNCIAKSS